MEIQNLGCRFLSRDLFVGTRAMDLSLSSPFPQIFISFGDEFLNFSHFLGFGHEEVSLLNLRLKFNFID